MRKPHIAILVVAAVAVTGLIWWALASQPKDPVYDGHPLSYWLDGPDTVGSGVDLRNGGGVLVYFRHLGDFSSTTNIGSLDSNALPFLIGALERRDNFLRSSLVKLRPHFPDWLKSRVAVPRAAVDERRLACGFLAGMGATARPAIPNLIRSLREDDDGLVRGMNAVGLREIANGEDKPVVEALVAATTKDTNADVRFTAGDALWRLNPEASAKVGRPGPAPFVFPTVTPAGAPR